MRDPNWIKLNAGHWEPEMDPLSVAVGSIAVITHCVQISKVLRSTIETYNNCPDELIALLSSTEGLLIQLKRLDAVKSGLTDEHSRYLEEVCGEAWEMRCRRTVEELNTLVWKVKTLGTGSKDLSQQLQGQPGNDPGSEYPLPTRTPFLGRLAWFFKKEEATKLSKKLTEHEEIISRALLTITMCA